MLYQGDGAGNRTGRRRIEQEPKFPLASTYPRVSGMINTAFVVRFSREQTWQEPIALTERENHQAPTLSIQRGVF